MNNTLTLVSRAAIVLIALANFAFLAQHVHADDDCHDPVASWQPREVLKKRLEQQGWIVQRIRIDDNCYEVRALDEQGRKVKATYAPASLTLLKLKVKHDKHPYSGHPHRSEHASADKDKSQ